MQLRQSAADAISQWEGGAPGCQQETLTTQLIKNCGSVRVVGYGGASLGQQHFGVLASALACSSLRVRKLQLILFVCLEELMSPWWCCVACGMHPDTLASYLSPAFCWVWGACTAWHESCTAPSAAAAVQATKCSSSELFNHGSGHAGLLCNQTLSGQYWPVDFVAVGSALSDHSKTRCTPSLQCVCVIRQANVTSP